MRQPTVSFISLGCAKNLVDSEVMLGKLAVQGFAVSEQYKGSDVLVINTCGFLQDSIYEGLRTIKNALELKRRGHVKAVVVAGCMPQRLGPDADLGVDAVIGVTDRDAVVDACREVLAKKHPELVRIDQNYPKYEIDRDRLRITPRHYAYVRVAEGCNHTCAFCTIPSIRGKFRSKPMDELLEECRQLAATGARELCLIAQDTNEWGLDLYRKPKLHELLNAVSAIDGVRWVRLLYCYPTMFTDEHLACIRDNPKVVKYVDMPIQHTRQKMLRLMRRGITQEKQRELIRKIQAIPGVVFRTTVIVGFPQETEEDFRELLDDLREIKVDRLGAFTYSREPGTPADAMDGHVPEEEKIRRYNAVMSQQRKISLEKNRALVGKTIECIVDKREKGRLIGRTYGDAPDGVDQTVTIKSADANPGDIVGVRITAARAYDLMGEVQTHDGGK